MPDEIEIKWQDVAAKWERVALDAQRDCAMRYAMCEALKRKIAELENGKTSPQPPGSDGA